jgi:hypothetical protein
MNTKQTILQNARVCEIRDRASLVAGLCRPPAIVELSSASRRGAGDRRRLLLLLARERRRNAQLAKLIEE